jgi:hypothetical protein
MNVYQYNLPMKTSINKVFAMKRVWHSIAFSMLSISLSGTAFANADTYMNTLINQAIQSHPLIGSARAEQQATTESIRAAKLNMNRPEIVGDSTLQENTTMKTRNYTPEMKERAVRMLGS